MGRAWSWGQARRLSSTRRCRTGSAVPERAQLRFQSIFGRPGEKMLVRAPGHDQASDLLGPRDDLGRDAHAHSALAAHALAGCLAKYGVPRPTCISTAAGHRSYQLEIRAPSESGRLVAATRPRASQRPRPCLKARRSLSAAVARPRLWGGDSQHDPSATKGAERIVCSGKGAAAPVEVRATTRTRRRCPGLAEGMLAQPRGVHAETFGPRRLASGAKSVSPLRPSVSTANRTAP